MAKKNTEVELNRLPGRKTIILQGIPEFLKSEFKSAAAKHNKSMKDVLLRLMEGFATGKIKLP